MIAPKCKTAASAAVFFVRPAWMHSCGCKSRRELVTVSEVKRNCGRGATVGRKRGAKLRANEQEPDGRRCQAGRADIKPQGFCGQGEVA